MTSTQHFTVFLEYIHERVNSLIFFQKISNIIVRIIRFFTKNALFVQTLITSIQKSHDFCGFSFNLNFL